MTALPATTLPPDDLAPMLRAWAAGIPADEAAVQLVIGHGMWLTRPDFLRECVTVHAADSGTAAEPGMVARISWERAAEFAEQAPAARSELAVLRLACSLGGVGTGALSDLTSGLDVTNTTRVLDALAHRAGWHERGIRHTVDGRQDTAGPAPRPGISA